MFAVVFTSGTQFSLTARDVANLLNTGNGEYSVKRYEAGYVISVKHGEDSFVITAPAPNGLDMVYQAGGPDLSTMKESPIA